MGSIRGGPSSLSNDVGTTRAEPTPWQGLAQPHLLLLLLLLQLLLHLLLLKQPLLLHLEQLLLQRRRHVLRLLLQLRRQVRQRVLLLLLRRHLLLLLLLLRSVLGVRLLAVLAVLRLHGSGRLAHVGGRLHDRILRDAKHNDGGQHAANESRFNATLAVRSCQCRMHFVQLTTCLPICNDPNRQSSGTRHQHDWPASLPRTASIASREFPRQAVLACLQMSGGGQRWQL